MIRRLAKHITTSPPPQPPLLRQLLRHPTTHNHHSTTTTNPMEVEVKLLLRSSASHQKLTKLLSPFHTKTLLQENIFFDTPTSLLSSSLSALRLRFYPHHCILSLKSKPLLDAGISRIEEHEEPVDPTVARAAVAEPWRLLSLTDSTVMRRVKEEFSVGENLVCLGGFRNVRNVFEWKGLKLEVDETDYGFGTSYEIECESEEPERAKGMIEEFLNENGIGYSYSKVSKFAVFRSGKLPQQLFDGM